MVVFLFALKGMGLIYSNTMPPRAIDHSKTLIYKICCKDVNVKDAYVGETTSKTKRKSCHKVRCSDINSSFYNLYVYQFIRKHGGWENWDMVVIENYPCKTSDEARTRERHWIETLGATLNSNRAILTKEDELNDGALYREANREIIRLNDRMSYAANPEKKLEYQRTYAKANPEKIRERGADYREANFEKIRENKKAYYNANAKNISTRATERIMCDCGTEHSRSGTCQHKKTAKHIAAMALL